MTLLKVNNISKSYKSRSVALGSISFNINQKSKLGIVGETGSGKSTLLKLIAGLEQLETGQILFENEKVIGPLDQLIPGHPSIAYLSQDYKLPKFKTVEDYLYDPYVMTSDEPNAVYTACNIEHFISSDTQALSGGERQRVALAKQLMSRPKLLLLDEPFSNLDNRHKSIIKTTLKNIEDNLGVTIMLVAHDPLDILSWAEIVMVLKNGELIQNGSPEEVYNHPLNEYVAGLFGDYNLISNSVWDIPEPGKSIIRPHKFKLSSNLEQGLTAKVKSVEYNGEFDRVICLKGKESIIVNCPVNQCQVGELVAVSLI